MKAYTRLAYNPFISRVAAVFLTITLLLGIVWPNVMAGSANLSGGSSSAVLYFDGTEIYDGMEIDPTGYIHARYSFTATRSELSGAEAGIILPERLNAAYATSKTITGTDSKGNPISVGELTIDEKLSVKVSFFDLLYSADTETGDGEDPTLEDETDNGTLISENMESGDEENADGELATSGNTESGGEVNTGGEIAASDGTETNNGENADGVPAQEPASAAIDPYEIITVEFDVPVKIDTTGLTANEDGSYDVELESGSETVTVVLLPAPVAAAPVLAGFNTRAAANVWFWQAVELKNSDLYLPGQSVPIANNNVPPASVSSSTEFKLRVEFEMPLDKAQIIYNTLSDTTYYQIQIPRGLTAIATPDEILRANITADGETETKQYGVLHVDANGAYVIFTGDFWTDVPDYHPATTLDFKGGFDFGCKLDMNEIKTSDAYTITLNDGTTINLEIQDNKKPDTLFKTKGVLNADAGIITWEVTYTAGSKRVLSTNPLTFTDTFANADEFDFNNDYGLNVAYTNTTTKQTTNETATSGITVGTPAGSFSYTIDSSNAANFGITNNTINPGDKIVFKYQTKVTDYTYKGGDNKVGADSVITNTAEIEQATSGTTTSKNTATVTANDKKWLPIKTYKQNGDIITWTVTVVARDTEVTKLTFYDYIDTGLTVTGDVKVKPLNGAEVPLAAGTYPNLNQYQVISNTSVPSTVSNKNITGVDTLTFDLPQISDGKGGYTYDKSYTVTYTTRINNANFANINQIEFDNIAWLDVTWPNGSPITGAQYSIIVNTGPTAGIGPGIDTHIIQKAGTVNVSNATSMTDGTGHYVNWTITVNPYNLLTVTGGTITDELEDYLTYRPGTLKIQTFATPGSTANTVYSSANGDTTYFENYTDPTQKTTFRYNLSNISYPASYSSTDRIVITFTTDISENMFYGPATAGTTGVQTTAIGFNNRVDFIGSVDYNGTIPVTDFAVAAPTYTNSSVVNKLGFTSFKYNDHTITWRVEVNRNRIAMYGNVTLEDTFPSWLDEIKSVEVWSGNNKNGTNYTNFTIDYPNTLNGNKLTIAFPSKDGSNSAENSICNKKRVYVYITATVNVNEIPALKASNAASTTLSNTITLTWNDKNGNPLPSRESTVSYGPITNNMLGKAADKSTYDTGYDPTTNKITYKVKINPLELKMKLNECILEDVIPPELSLDLGSVKLYRAKASSATNLVYTESDLVTSFKCDYDITTTPGKQILTVVLPDAESAYVLVYACDVLNYGSITNNVTLYGSGMTASVTNGDTVTVGISSWASGVKLTQEASLEIVKVNSLDETIAIPNITFQLWVNVYGNEFLYQEKTTDASGKLTFTGLSAQANVKYWLVEVDTSADAVGYNSETAAYVTTENGRAVSYPLDDYAFLTSVLTAGRTATVQIINRPISHTIEFRKVNDDGELLTGSKFKITEKNSSYATPYTDEATSVDGVVKFTDVPVGDTAKTYKLEETASTPHYLIPVDGDGNPVEYELTIDTNGDYTIKNMTTLEVYDSTAMTKPFEVVNSYSPASRTITADVYFRKIDDLLLSRLNGATFRITEDISALTYRPAGYEPYTDVSTSSGDGLVMFKNVPVGLYSLVEVEPAPHYVHNNETFILTVNRDKSFRVADKNGVTLYDSKTHDADDPWKLVNEYAPISPPYPSMDVSFRKVRSGTDIGVGGAVFQIEEDTTSHHSSPGAHSDTATSASDGLVTFKDVNVGVYDLSETVAPPGYKKDDDVYMLIVYAGNTYRIIDPDGNTVYDSGDPVAFPNLWQVKNVYSPIGVVTTKMGLGPSPGPTDKITSPSIPHPHSSKNTLVTYDDGKTYIELDENGNPVGEWRRERNVDGYLVWIYEEYSALPTPHTGYTIVPGDNKDVYIEIDENGNPVGEWRREIDENGKTTWVYEEYSSGYQINSTDHPDTGDHSMLFLWILSFYTSAAILIALAWMNWKKKRR